MSDRPRLKAILATLGDDLARPGRIANAASLARRIQRALEPLRPDACHAYGSAFAGQGAGEYLTHLGWALERADESRYAGLALSLECSTSPSLDGLRTALHPLLDVWAERRVLVATVPRGGLDDSGVTGPRIETVCRHLRRHHGSVDGAKVGVLLREAPGGRAACWIVRLDGRIKLVAEYVAKHVALQPAQGQLFASPMVASPTRND